MENSQDKIKDYINHQLTGGELADFEAQLATDAALQAEVQASKDVLFVFKNEKLLALNAHLRYLRDTITLEPEADFDLDEFLKEPTKMPQDVENTEGSSGTSPTAKYWWWGAGLALIGILSGVFYQYQQKQTTLKMLSERYISAEIMAPEAPSEAFDNSSIDLAIRHYKKKEYAEAIPDFVNHLKQSPASMPNYDVRLYLGFSYLMVRNNEKATEELSRVAHADYAKIPINMAASGRYYGVLAQMAAGKTDSLRVYLGAIKNDEAFGADASVILQELDKAGIK